MRVKSFLIASVFPTVLASTAFAAGKVSLTIADTGGSMVACKVEAVDASNKVVQTWPKLFSRASFDLAPGKYSFVCRLPGYAEGRLGPIDVVDGKETLQQIKIAKVATKQGALQSSTVGKRRMPVGGWKSRWGVGVAAKGIAPSKGVLKKSGTPAAPTGPTGKVVGKIVANGALIPCRAMEVKAANGAVMPIAWKLTSRYQLDLPAGAYALTCTPAGSYAAATVKATVQAGKSINLDFNLQKK